MQHTTHTQMCLAVYRNETASYVEITTYLEFLEAVTFVIRPENGVRHQWISRACLNR